MKKITLTEFWNSKYAMAIHCNTRQKAKKLLKAFDKLGKVWSGGYSYLNNFGEYEIYHQYTCYTNDGHYCSDEWYNDHGYTIYEFDEVDLDN